MTTDAKKQSATAAQVRNAEAPQDDAARETEGAMSEMELDAVAGGGPLFGSGGPVVAVQRPFHQFKFSKGH